MALKRLNQPIPPACSRQVPLGRRIVAYGPVRAALGAPTDAVARDQVWVAVEGLAVGRKGRCVAGEGGGKVVAGVKSVCGVRAVARRVGAIAN